VRSGRGEPRRNGGPRPRRRHGLRRFFHERAPRPRHEARPQEREGRGRRGRAPGSRSLAALCQGARPPDLHVLWTRAIRSGVRRGGTGLSLRLRALDGGEKSGLRSPNDGWRRPEDLPPDRAHLARPAGSRSL
jgi:hypothetical protein